MQKAVKSRVGSKGNQVLQKGPKKFQLAILKDWRRQSTNRSFLFLKLSLPTNAEEYKNLENLKNGPTQTLNKG